MARAKDIEAPPESDRFLDAPHPRETQTLFGHDRAQAQILNAYRAGRLPQAWILGGREGIGKATLAWHFARFLLANPDPSSQAVQRAVDLSVDPDHPAAKRIASLSHGDLLLTRREWDSKTKKHFTRIRAEDVRRLIDLFEFFEIHGYIKKKKQAAKLIKRVIELAKSIFCRCSMLK